MQEVKKQLEIICNSIQKITDFKIKQGSKYYLDEYEDVLNENEGIISEACDIVYEEVTRWVREFNQKRKDMGY